MKKEYGYSSFSTNDSKFLLKYLVNLVFENNDSLFLMNQSLEYLRKNKIILPAITTLENLVWEAKNKSEKFIINTIVSSLNPTQRNKLNDIVFLQSEKLKGKTILGWLKEPIGSPSPDNFLKVIEKLEYIRSLNLENTQLGVASGKCGFTTLRAFSPLIPRVYRLFIYLMAYVIL